MPRAHDVPICPHCRLRLIAALQPRVSLGGGGSWTRLSGGNGPNSRVAASGALRWSVTRALSLAAAMRGLLGDDRAERVDATAAPADPPPEEPA